MPTSMPLYPAGSPDNIASPVDNSARLARAIACTQLRWLRTRRRSGKRTRECPGLICSTTEPIEPVYGIIQPNIRLNNREPKGRGLSRCQIRISFAPSAFASGERGFSVSVFTVHIVQHPWMASGLAQAFLNPVAPLFLYLFTRWLNAACGSGCTQADWIFCRCCQQMQPVYGTGSVQ